jgi:hypothetical protein
MPPPTIHVLGNAALDETFRVRTLPRPGESVLAAEAGRGLGGKGANVAVAVARAGVPARLVAALGRDEAGGALRALLQAEGLAGALRTVEAPTDRSLILVDEGGENIVVTTQAAALALDPAAIEAALDAARPATSWRSNSTCRWTPLARPCARRAGAAAGRRSTPRRSGDPCPRGCGLSWTWPSPTRGRPRPLAASRPCARAELPAW